ncbi:MAG TPA: VCBS repeat-containing protein, partial [Bryobacteraceae bacterium]|nr:VCBS repeat-containing protein [Bryobacteraceae bacterium]
MSRGLTRRAMLGLLTIPAVRARAQGISSRGVKPMPRGKPSGLPWHSRFVDVAEQAGLRAPVIYGGVVRKDYILETVGCGVAFIDYDNDGWLDIFILSGTRMGGTPDGAYNRLYKNNRDGTFTDVTIAAGLKRSGWASAVCVGDYDNDGNDDLFITYWGQNVLYHNNGDGTFTDVTDKSGLGGEGHYGQGVAVGDYDNDGYRS